MAHPISVFVLVSTFSVTSYTSFFNGPYMALFWPIFVILSLNGASFSNYILVHVLCQLVLT